MSWRVLPFKLPLTNIPDQSFHGIPSHLGGSRANINKARGQGRGSRATRQGRATRLGLETSCPESEDGGGGSGSQWEGGQEGRRGEVAGGRIGRENLRIS